MNKTAIKNFATWARKKLIADITYKASLMGITDQEIKESLPQSMIAEEAYDIGTKEPYVISGKEVTQRAHLAKLITDRAKGSDYTTAFYSVVEEVAYTWFNRLIAIRFMEVNDYMPDHIRVLSSENGSKLEPDMVTTPFDTELEFTEGEKKKIIQLKNDNAVDELFQMIFIKECNSLNQYLPRLFEKTADYTELLLNISVTDKEGVVYHLVHDIDEQDFDINNIGEDGRPTGQVEIIGWLYQYYNAELKDETFALLKKNKKITKERIPSATQLFTPDWIVRYMVENSLGRVWLNGHPSDDLKKNWIYYIDEAKQEPEVEAKLKEEREAYKKLRPEDLTLMDPSMGSGHILVYGFDVLMQIYTSVGYSERDAAQSILKNNLYGLDIDERAFQLAYFAVMMKGRQYDRRILTRDIEPHVYVIEESNDINRDHLKFLGNLQDEQTRKKNQKELVRLLDQFKDAKIYGSILKVEGYDFGKLKEFVEKIELDNQYTIETAGIDETIGKIKEIAEIASIMQKKYLIACTNPPYLNSSAMTPQISKFVKENYPDSKTDLFTIFIEVCGSFITKNGLYAMITQQGWMFLSSLESLRVKLLDQATLNMIHLGTRAFDSIGGEVVQTTSFVKSKKSFAKWKGSYIKLIDFDNEDKKRKGLLNAISNRACGYLFETCTESLKSIPGIPMAYWISRAALKGFQKYKVGDYFDLRVGLMTTDNEKFLRCFWEVKNCDICYDATDSVTCASSGKKWFPHNKGGSYRKWYGNRSYLCDWENNGERIKQAAISKYPYLKGNPNFVVHDDGYYFKESVSWSEIALGTYAFRYYDRGFTFNIKGMSAFPKKEYSLYDLLAYANSNVCSYFGNIINSSISFGIKSFSSVPFLVGSGEAKKLALENVQLSKSDWDSFENSWDFQCHPLVKYNVSGFISGAFSSWQEECDNRFTALKKNEEELNNIFINIYGLQGELSPNESDSDVTVRKADLSRDIRSLLSYAVGCMFGRYSLDIDGLAYAGGDWDVGKYSTFIPDADNVIPITDEDYFDDDIVGLLIQWLKKVYGEDTLEENLDFIAKELGNKGNTSREIIRNYFLTDFFKDHCKTYSVTGSGKRPIYWLYDSGKKNGFKALIYMHRYNEDTTGMVRVKYLHRMEQIYMSEIDRMQDMMDNSKSAHDVSVASKRKEKLQKQLKECKDYDEKIAHLALDRIAIDLDDGVKVNYRKVQTGSDGKFYEVLADSKSIMAKER